MNAIKIATHIPDGLYQTGVDHINRLLSENKDFCMIIPIDNFFNDSVRILEKWMTLRLSKMWICGYRPAARHIDDFICSSLDNELGEYDTELYRLYNHHELGPFDIDIQLIDPDSIILEVIINGNQKNSLQFSRAYQRIKNNRQNTCTGRGQRNILKTKPTILR